MRRIGFYLFMIAVFLLAPLLALPQKAVPAPAAAPTPTPTAVARPAAPYRAVWVSYLEWEQVDFSSAEAFTQAIGTMLDNIQSIGATVVLAQVRPFGDALYPSDYFPFSHLCTGTQDVYKRQGLVLELVLKVEAVVAVGQCIVVELGVVARDAVHQAVPVFGVNEGLAVQLLDLSLIHIYCFHTRFYVWKMMIILEVHLMFNLARLKN